jgi:hypothetical protein
MSINPVISARIKRNDPGRTMSSNHIIIKY